MVRNVVVAVTQFACTSDRKKNVAKAEELVRKAASGGAQIILLQELFESLYWCQRQHPAFFDLASPFEGNALVHRFADVAKELGVVLVVPFFESAGCAFFNSAAVVDADGRILGRYRKSHIPDGPGYQEKFYFSPGDSGLLTWPTRFAVLGVAICWDQWFPEAARALALRGAELILYPTAIGSEPQDPTVNSYPHWARAMQGHSAANLVPILAANRIGWEAIPDPEQPPPTPVNASTLRHDPSSDSTLAASIMGRDEGDTSTPPPAEERENPPNRLGREECEARALLRSAEENNEDSEIVATKGDGGSGILFYGGSFITDAKGAIVAQVGAKAETLAHGNMDPNPELVEGVAVHTLDLDGCRQLRQGWGVFRDRRPDLYGTLISLDGSGK